MTPYIQKFWDYMPVAEAFAAKSKDPSTKVGAIVLGPGHEVRSSGWNGAPRRCGADTDERYQSREEKLFWVTHAEANAIANAARSGVSLANCVMVVTHAPCMSCAKLIVQSGIMMVISRAPDEAFAARWKDDMDRAAALFLECGVSLVLMK